MPGLVTALTPSKILFGAGAAGRIPEALEGVGSVRPLLLIDPNILGLGIAEPLLQALRHAGVAFAVFSAIAEDPTDAVVAGVAAAIEEGRHDAVVAVGGGSAIDAAKAAAIVATIGEDVRALKVPRIVDQDVMPVIAVPTTAGTGSEVTRACVITDTDSHEKMLILGTACLPRVAIVDFELTLSCPFRLTADTGLDALTHALEAIVNRNANPHADALAISALGLIGANLELACFEPGNRAAREAMMIGATHAGLAVSNTSTALVHGMSRPLGAFFHVPHGLSNAMLLPAVTEFSAGAAPAAYAKVAVALGWADRTVSPEDAVATLIDRFRRLNARLEVPSPEAYGIDRERYRALLPTMAAQGLASGTPGNNPRVPTADEMIAIYAAVWSGG